MILLASSVLFTDRSQRGDSGVTGYSSSEMKTGEKRSRIKANTERVLLTRHADRNVEGPPVPDEVGHERHHHLARGPQDVHKVAHQRLVLGAGDLHRQDTHRHEGPQRPEPREHPRDEEEGVGGGEGGRQGGDRGDQTKLQS